ncbi:MAG: hypothetical protein KZY74_02530 [Paenibacillaceae bacterium]|uniref:Uncharacterized protein n=1 Tax=Paenibacillus mellifer TaxID=2937794 RepID=A0A9X2BNA2_9BACL|nr:hypothetical protein [Paenibacillus mellifer]MBW4838242.1 hypothetical protein [Paenibacillaceae bacterium]MCK8485838.1 hypothetical protein [Paenibacillus mellifer]
MTNTGFSLTYNENTGLFQAGVHAAAEPPLVFWISRYCIGLVLSVWLFRRL